MKQKWKIKGSVEKNIPKKYSFLASFIGLIICAIIGLTQKYMKIVTGSADLSWVVWIGALPLIVILSFFWKTMILNPRIKQLIEKLNKSNDPT